MNNQDSKSRWLIQYTLLFSLAALVVYWESVFYGKSFICNYDGYFQPFNFLMYYGNYLRNLLKNVFLNHDIHVPPFELSLGLGGSIFGSLNYYGLGDVLNLLAVFFPPEKTETLYDLLVLIRLYLAGIAFFLFCSHHVRNSGILLGTLIYVFSYWTIEASCLHAYFLNPLIYFPLILLGIDFILEKNAPALFAAACTLAAYASVYFFYMMSILAFIYAIVRYISLYSKDKNIRHFAGKFFLATASYLAALVLALPVLLPFARTVLSGGRIGRQGGALLYEPLFYMKFPIAFVNASADHWTSMGYSVVALAAVFLLFFRTKPKEKSVYKFLFLLCLLMLLSPFAGHIMNGSGYATNRWTWAFALLISVITAGQAESVFSLRKRYLWLLIGLTIVFAVPTLAVRAHGKESYKMMAILLAVNLFVLSLCFLVVKNKKACCYAIVFSNMFLSACSHYSPYFFGILNRTVMDNGASYTDKMNSWCKLLDDNAIDTERKYRVEYLTRDSCCLGSMKEYEANSAMLFNRYSTAFYYSSNDSSVLSLLRDVQIPSCCDSFYAGLDGRVFLETFLGCRYCAVGNENTDCLPYGYGTQVASDERRAVFENKNVLPLVFAYGTYMEKAEYDVLPSVKKQQALLQAAALEVPLPDKEQPGSPKLEYTDKPVPYTIKSVSADITVQGNSCIVKKPGMSIDIECSLCGPGEYYLVFGGLDFWNGRRELEDNNSIISVSHGSLTKCFDLRAQNDYFYSRVVDFIFNCGYISDAEETITFHVSFSNPGTYSFNNLDVVCQPVEKIAEYVSILTEDKIDYHYADGRMYVSCDMNADKLLCVSAPYQAGSYAVIDGKKQKCIRVSNFATGTFVPAGKHEVKICF